MVLGCIGASRILARFWIPWPETGNLYVYDMGILGAITALAICQYISNCPQSPQSYKYHSDSNKAWLMQSTKAIANSFSISFLERDLQSCQIGFIPFPRRSEHLHRKSPNNGKLHYNLPKRFDQAQHLVNAEKKETKYSVDQGVGLWTAVETIERCHLEVPQRAS